MTKFWVTPLRSWYAVSNLLTQLSSSLQEAGVGNLRTKRLLVLASTSAVPCTRHLDSCCSKHSHSISHFLVHTHLSPPALTSLLQQSPPFMSASLPLISQLRTALCNSSLPTLKSEIRELEALLSAIKVQVFLSLTLVSTTR
jgi:hypothetical protein